MSIKTPQNKALALYLLKGKTGKSERYCKGVINRMSEVEFRDLIWLSDSDSESAPVAPESLPDPEPASPVPSPSPKPKKRSVGRPRGSKADSTMRLYSFNCPPELMDQVADIAKAEMTSSATIIRRALKLYIESQGD